MPVVLHLDHIESKAVRDQAPAARITSIMIDNGRLPYADNVEQTASAVGLLHRDGLFVEAELGWVGGKDTQVESAHQPGVRTDPAQAAEYVGATGVDALAVAVGSSHAMTSQTATLDLDLIRLLASAVPVPLVLHGSSGVPDDMLRAACDAGMRKINVGTALNIAFTGALRTSSRGRTGWTPGRTSPGPGRLSPRLSSTCWVSCPGDTRLTPALGRAGHGTPNRRGRLVDLAVARNKSDRFDAVSPAVTGADQPPGTVARPV